MEELDDELIAFLKQDFEEADGVPSGVPAKETKGSKYLKQIPELTDEVVTTLMEKILLYCPSLKRIMGDSKSPMSHLCSSLQCLQSLLYTKSINRNTCREKSWTQFHTGAKSGFPLITRVTGNKQISTILALEAFDYMVDKTFSTPNSLTATARSNLTASDLTPVDRRVIHHIGGSVLSKLKRRYRARRKKDQEDCIQMLCGKQPLQEAGLTVALDRGGLKYLTCDSLLLFMELECSFRNVFHGHQRKFSLASFMSDIPDIVSGKFNDVICESRAVHDRDEVVLLDMIKLFFKIRCHAKLRKIVQAFRCKSKVSKRAKSLRKSLVDK